MSRMVFRSILLATLLIAGSHAAMAAQPRTSPAFAEQFTAAVAARNGKRWGEVEAKAREVLASPTRKSPDDLYAAHGLLLEAAKARNNTPALIESLEAMLGSGFPMTPTEQAAYRTGLVTAHFQQKNYQQAIRHGADLIKSGGANEDVYTVVGQSYYQTRNYAEAVKLFEGLVSTAEKAGRKPDRRQLALLQDAYAKAGNEAAAQATLEKLVRHYPTADTWMVLLYEVKKEKLDPRQKVHLYRLMDATGNLKHPVDIRAYSDAAMQLSLYEEANRALEVGIKGNVFKTTEEQGRADRYRKSNIGLAAKARAGLPALEAAAKAAPTGNELAAVAMHHFSFMQFPQAITAAKAALAKGGLKGMADVQLTLGIAQLKAGQKAEAAQTFR